jgi:hypothetical protein
VGMVAKKKKSKTHEVLVWKAGCGDALGKSIMFSQVCSTTFSAFGRHCIEWILDHLI